MKLRKLMLSLVLGASFIASPTIAQEADPSELMRVTSYDLVSKKRVGRTTFEYEYALTVENNTATDYSGVFVTLNSTSSAAELTDSNAEIGTFNAFSQKGASDTIKVRVDRRSRFNPNSLTAQFDDDTVKGIDTDKNGVRDDIDAFILKEAETDQQFLLLRAISEQKSILFSTEDEIESAEALSRYVVLSTCWIVDTGRSTVLDMLDIKLTNSGQRRISSEEMDNRIGAINPPVPSVSLDVDCASFR